MFTPLPLRLWCMANMAPALTEAATQARAKLSSSREGHPTIPSLVARRASTPTSLEGGTTLTPAEKEGQGLKPSQVVSFPKDLLTAGIIEAREGVTTGLKQLDIETLKELASAVRKPTYRQQPKEINMNSPNPETATPTGTKQIVQITNPPTTVVNGIGLSNRVPSPVLSTMANSTTRLTSSNGSSATSTVSKSSGSIPSKDMPEVPESTASSAISTSAATTSNVKVRFMTNTEAKPDITKRQRDMERRAERILRRLRRLQSRQAVVHIKQQLSGVVDHQHKNLQTMAKSMKSPNQSASVDLKTELLQSEDVKSLSTAALVTLVRKLQSSQALSLRQRLAHQQAANEGGSSVLRLDEDLCMEMNRVAGTLQMNLHHLESALDSDATESSSGGESCDEDFDFDYEKPPRSSL